MAKIIISKTDYGGHQRPDGSQIVYRIELGNDHDESREQGWLLREFRARPFEGHYLLECSFDAENYQLYGIEKTRFRADWGLYRGAMGCADEIKRRSELDVKNLTKKPKKQEDKDK